MAREIFTNIKKVRKPNWNDHQMMELVVVECMVKLIVAGLNRIFLVTLVLIIKEGNILFMVSYIW